MYPAGRKTLAAIGVLGAAAAGWAAIAGAAQNNTGTTGTTATTATTASGYGGPGGPGGRADETPLTGETATKVKAAALEKVSGGTIVRVETDADHGSPYEAHVRKSDGTEVEVLVSKDFEVTAVNELRRP
jgi:uncharacterized membrane protein YkoI